MPRTRRARAAAPLLLAAVVAGGACSRNEASGREPKGGAPAAAASGSAPAAGGDDRLARADAARIIGDSTAPLWMVVVSDFQCPYCQRWEAEAAPAIMRDYVKTGRVRMAFVNLPLSMHPNAGPAAEAAMCAGSEGKFWPVHDAIFASQKAWAARTDGARFFDSLAVAAGVDAARYRDCIASGVVRPLVQADAQRAEAAGVRSTPSFLISVQGQPGSRPAAIQGAAPEASFRAVLDSMLRVSGSAR